MRFVGRRCGAKACAVSAAVVSCCCCSGWHQSVTPNTCHTESAHNCRCYCCADARFETRTSHTCLVAGGLVQHNTATPRGLVGGHRRRLLLTVSLASQAVRVLQISESADVSSSSVSKISRTPSSACCDACATAIAVAMQNGWLRDSLCLATELLCLPVVQRRWGVFSTTSCCETMLLMSWLTSCCSHAERLMPNATHDDCVPFMFQRFGFTQRVVFCQLGEWASRCSKAEWCWAALVWPY
jgi:hypothetical protein